MPFLFYPGLPHAKVFHEAPRVCTQVVTHVSRALTGIVEHAGELLALEPRGNCGPHNCAAFAHMMNSTAFAYNMGPPPQDEAPRSLCDLRVGRGSPGFTFMQV